MNQRFGKVALAAAIAVPSVFGLGALIMQPASAASNSTTATTCYGPCATTTTVSTGVSGSISPTTVGQGGTVTLNVNGLVPSTTYTVVLHSTPVTLGTMTSNTAGEATGTFTIPAGTALGAHTVDVLNPAGAVVFSGSITVVASTTATTSSSLPLTGTDIALTGGLAAVAIGAGGLLVLSSRKRRQQAWTENGS